jgi:predicted transposase
MRVCWEHETNRAYQAGSDVSTARFAPVDAETFNAACNAIADVAFAHRLANKIELQKLVYYDICQQFGLSAQMAIGAITRVAEVYKRGNWG